MSSIQFNQSFILNYVIPKKYFLKFPQTLATLKGGAAPFWGGRRRGDKREVGQSA
jgi:hypothetical protein